MVEKRLFLNEVDHRGLLEDPQDCNWMQKLVPSTEDLRNI